MKKLITLIAVLCTLIDTAMAQMPQTYYDAKVLERLDKETRAHTVFAKNALQPEFTIVTANDEILELNYPCFVYYVNYTGNIADMYIIVGPSHNNMLEVKTTSNTAPDDIAEWRDITNTPRIVECDFQNPLTDLLWLKEKIENFQENTDTDVVIYQCSYFQLHLGLNFGFLIYENSVQHFYNCNGEELYIDAGIVGGYEIQIWWQELIWKKTKEDYNDSLLHTKWKLLGIGSIDTEVVQELEPKDCEKCYTLTFNSDSTFQTFASTGSALGYFTADYITQNFQVDKFANIYPEFADAYLYISLFSRNKLQSFSLAENELRLYYNNGENYLLFKPAEL